MENKITELQEKILNLEKQIQICLDKRERLCEKRSVLCDAQEALIKKTEKLQNKLKLMKQDYACISAIDTKNTLNTFTWTILSPEEYIDWAITRISFRGHTAYSVELGSLEFLLNKYGSMQGTTDKKI